MNYFTRTHHQTLQFLRQLAEITIARGGKPQVGGFRYDAQQNQIQSLGINSSPGEQTSVQTMLYAAQARQNGLDLDDTAIRNWLTAFTDGRLSDAEINGVLQTATRNQLGQFHLYEQLRAHLLSEAYHRKTLAGLAAEGRPIVPPAQQWDLFQRLNRRAVADAYAVNVSEFIAQTSPSPSLDEIRRVYEEGKTRFPDDQSPLPAFRRPHTANIQFVAGSLEEFIEREIASLSEEQLRAEYQRRLQGGDFRMPEPPAAPTPPAAPEPPAEPTDPAEPTTPADPAETAAPGPAAPTQPAESGDDPQSADDPQPQQQPSDDQVPDDQVPDDQVPDDQVPEDQAPNDQASGEPTAGEQSAAPRPGRPVRSPGQGKAIQLTAFRAQDEALPVVDEPVVDEPVPAEPAAGEPATAQAPLDGPATGERAANEPPATEPATSKPADGEPTRTQTFEDVRDEIARSLARQPAMAKLDAAINEIETIMRDHFTEVAIAGPNVERRPAQPDLAALAEQRGLSYTETGMVDARQIQEFPIARSFGAGAGMQRGNPFLQTMFIERPPLLSPVRTLDPQADRTYVSWKVQEREASIPTLEEVRDEVILAIRTAEARRLARAEAERLAAQFNKSTQPAGELIPEDRASQFFESLGPFSWMNSFGFGMQAFMGNVPELDQVGEAFMRQVFTSEQGHWGAAPNAPETVYYVVRPTEFSPSTDELYQRFAQLIQRLQASTLAVEEVQRIRDSHYEALEKRIGFQWNEAALQSPN